LQAGNHSNNVKISEGFFYATQDNPAIQEMENTENMAECLQWDLKTVLPVIILGLQMKG
jgi:hypothetical protein